ncbi:MAG: hypothetical protein WKF57_06540 [Nakamurella sp.]
MSAFSPIHERWMDQDLDIWTTGTDGIVRDRVGSASMTRKQALRKLQLLTPAHELLSQANAQLAAAATQIAALIAELADLRHRTTAAQSHIPTSTSGRPKTFAERMDFERDWDRRFAVAQESHARSAAL